MTATVWIGMQPDETIAHADCGCCLYRSGDAALNVEGAGTNNDPLVTQCALHAAAPALLDAAIAALVVLPKIRRNESTYAALSKAIKKARSGA